MVCSSDGLLDLCYCLSPRQPAEVLAEPLGLVLLSLTSYLTMGFPSPRQVLLSFVIQVKDAPLQF